MQQYSRGRLASGKIGYARLAGATAFMATVGSVGAPLSAAEPEFQGFPFVVICEFKGISHAYYFSQVDEDGLAIYITPDRQAAAITARGMAERVDGERSGSCADKTLSELREAGLAFDFPK